MMRRTTRREGYSGAGSAVASVAAPVFGRPSAEGESGSGPGPGDPDVLLADCSMCPPIPDARKPHGSYAGGKHPLQVYVNAVDLSNRYLSAPSGRRWVRRGVNLES
ncbi:hypothetical protein GCM10027590_61920 [Nocardiopsis nanhaiensis]